MNEIMRQTQKRLRTALAAVLLAGLAALALLLLLYPDRYTPRGGSGGGGFVALRYAGVNRAGSGGAVTPERLWEQLSALSSEGYVTVGKEEIASFRSGGGLPPKALYLAFVDGRGETALFAGRVLQKLGYCAAFPPGESGYWEYEGMPGPVRASYLESGYWEEMSDGFADGSGMNGRSGPLTWLPVGDWTGTNLLMRLADAAGGAPPARGVSGWDTLTGSLSSDGSALTLTSPSGKPGAARLQVGGKYGDWHLRVRFHGPAEQAVYLRTGGGGDSYIRISQKGDTLTGLQRLDGNDKTLFSSPVGPGEIDIRLYGSELTVKQGDETVAWVSAAVRQEGYLGLETVPGDGQAADGVFSIIVSRPEGMKEREVYRSANPLQMAWNKTARSIRAGMNWLRAAL